MKRNAQIFKSFKSNPNVDYLRAVKKSFSRSNKSLKKIKSKNFKLFIGTLNRNRPMAHNFHILKKFELRHFNPSSTSIESNSSENITLHLLLLLPKYLLIYSMIPLFLQSMQTLQICWINPW